MFKAFVSVTALAVALAVSAASYAQEVTGVIRSYDNGTRILILEDGPATCCLRALLPRVMNPALRYATSSKTATGSA
jgi:hypothetical protein